MKWVVTLNKEENAIYLSYGLILYLFTKLLKNIVLFHIIIYNFNNIMNNQRFFIQFVS